MIKLETYLVQNTLGEILKKWAGEDNVSSEVMVPTTRMRNDFRVNKNGKTYVVEFDGDQHYRDAVVIQRDNLKDSLVRQLGFVVVRIPYFIQLTTQTFKHYFNEDFEIETTFPHGFHATKMLPASFCPLGYSRLLKEVDALPDNVRADINNSLQNKMKSVGEQYTYFTCHIDTDEGRISFQDFVRISKEVHGDKYLYPHPL